MGYNYRRNLDGTYGGFVAVRCSTGLLLNCRNVKYHIANSRVMLSMLYASRMPPFRLGYLRLPQVTQGSCDRSFGIHVARIANFPSHVVSEAESLATALENGESLSAHFSDNVTKETTAEVCQPADVGQSGTSGEEDMSSGPKRKNADVSEVPVEKRSR